MQKWPQGLWSLFLGDAEIEGGGHVSAPTAMFRLPDTNQGKPWAELVPIELH